jgi:type VI secretion system protein ImpG
MSEELLPYYEQELKFLEAMGAEFAQRFPHVAGRLKLTGEAARDPHIERMIQAVALLNARVRHKLDDEFPELSESLLHVLFPHYLAPIPSLAIAQFELHDSQHEATAGFPLKRGTKLETQPDTQFEERCQYRTTQEVRLWPVKIEQARIERRPFAAPVTPRLSQADALLVLHLRTFSPEVLWGQLKIDKLRFYLHRHNNANVYRLLELLLNDVLEIAVAASPRDEQPFVLPTSSITLAGFNRQEALLPEDARTFPGYSLLSEYFAFPQKHLFFDLHFGQPQAADWAIGRSRCAKQDVLQLYFPLRRADADLVRDVKLAVFRLGCTPIVNLFEQNCEGATLSATESEALVVPDSRRPLGCEIYRIEEVETLAPGRAQAPLQYQPFFSWKHGVSRLPTTPTGQRLEQYWHASVREQTGSDPRSPDRRRRDFFLSLVDLGFHRHQFPQGWVLRVKAHCFNGDAPNHLEAGHQNLFTLDAGEAIGSVNCLAGPTPTLRPQRGSRALWRLISHLSLNHLSLTDENGGVDAAQALRELLELYNYRDESDTRALINSIVRLESKPAIRRVGWSPGAVGRGLEIRLELDESRLAGLGTYLFASVLERFFGMYANINSFSEFSVQSQQRRDKEGNWTWPMRTGDRVLI